MIKNNVTIDLAYYFCIMNYNSSITGIILAGGYSKRFGEEKGLYELRGKKLIEYAIDILKPLCDDIIISTNNPKAYSSKSLKTITDIHTGCGPLGGIHAGLSHTSTKDNLFIGCDMPLLPTALFKEFIDKSKNYQAVVAKHGSYTETMATYFNKNSLPVLEKAIKRNNLAVFEAIKPLKVFYLNVENHKFYNEHIFININSKDDINKIQTLP